MTVARRRRSRSTLALVSGFALAWLGCNSLLEIDDPEFVPLGVPNGEGGVQPTNEAGVLPDGAPATGPLVASRATVRIPRGEKKTFQITADITGKVGLPQLTADPPPVLPPQVTLSIEPAPVGENQWIVTLTAAADAAVFDQILSFHAITDRQEEIGTVNVRALVGLPGTPDISFGTLGVVKVDNAPVTNLGGRIFVVNGTSALIASENHDIWEVADDGKRIRQLYILDDLGGQCTLRFLAADSAGIMVASSCDEKTQHLAEGPRDAGDATSLKSTVQTRSMNAITRAQDAGFLLLDHDAGSTVQPSAAATPATLVALRPQARIVPMQTAPGFIAVGTSTDAVPGPQLVRVTGTPPAVSTDFGVGGAAKLPNPTGNFEPAAAAISGTGHIIVAVLAYAGAAGEASQVRYHVLQPNGTLLSQDQREMGDVFTAAASADPKNRFVVVGRNRTTDASELRRIFVDAGKDDGIAPGAAGVLTVPACKIPDVGIDEDGMILVHCGGDPTSSTVHRFWP